MHFNPASDHVFPFLALPQTAVEEESEYEPDDPATVREQNVRALLVLLPARVVDVVVKKAMHLAILHMKREATAQAERRRRSLLATRAEYRHIRTSAPKVTYFKEICETRLVKYSAAGGGTFLERLTSVENNIFACERTNGRYLRRVLCPSAAVCWREESSPWTGRIY